MYFYFFTIFTIEQPNSKICMCELNPVYVSFLAYYQSYVHFFFKLYNITLIHTYMNYELSSISFP